MESFQLKWLCGRNSLVHFNWNKKQWKQNIFAYKKNNTNQEHFNFSRHILTHLIFYLYIQINSLFFLFSFPFFILFPDFFCTWRWRGLNNAISIFSFSIRMGLRGFIFILMFSAVSLHHYICTQNNTRTIDRNHWWAGHVYWEWINNKFNVRDWGFTWATGLHFLES